MQYIKKLKDILCSLRGNSIIIIIRILYKFKLITALNSLTLGQKVYLRNKSSLSLYFDIFHKNEYGKLLNYEIENVLDCGANVGMTTLWFNKYLEPKKIISIEPDKVNYNFLLKNTQDFANIISIQAGVWKKNTKLNIEDVSKSNLGFIVKENLNGNIDAITIKQLCAKYKVDSISLLKLDIEGSEKEVFESLDDSLLNITKLILIEFHERYSPGCCQVVINKLYKRNTYLDFIGEKLLVVNRDLLTIKDKNNIRNLKY